MNIVVCVKHVPDSTADRRFEGDSTVDRVGVDGLLSELDEYAVGLIPRVDSPDPCTVLGHGRGLVKRFRCGDVIPGCDQDFTGDEDGILGEVAVHARVQHGVDVLTTETVAAVRAAMVIVVNRSP